MEKDLFGKSLIKKSCSGEMIFFMKKVNDRPLMDEVSMKEYK